MSFVKNDLDSDTTIHELKKLLKKSCKLMIQDMPMEYS